MNIIVCTGKSGATTTTEALAIDETVIDVSSASDLDVDDYIFITESDDSELECLGKLTAKDGNVITVQYGPASAKDSGAKVWRGTNLVDLGAGGTCYIPDYYHGLSTTVSVGGVPISNRIRDPYDMISFRVPMPTMATLLEWKTFINTTISGAGYFTFVNEARELYKVLLFQNNTRGTRLGLVYVEYFNVQLSVVATDDAAYVE